MSANTKFQVTQQCDFVIVKEDRSYGGPPEQVVLKVDGTSGKVTLGAFGSSQLLDDYWDKPAADGSAATATAEHTFMRAAGPITVKAVRFVPDAALTASDSNYATITISRRNADGSGLVVVASINTAITVAPFSGNFVQWQAVTLALTAANLSLIAGQLLTVAITKTGSGVVVPAGSVQIDYILA